MNVRMLNNLDKSKIEDFLMHYIEPNMFMLHNIQRAAIEYQNRVHHGEYYGTFDRSGNLTEIIVHYWNGNVMMHGKGKEISHELITLFYQNAIRPMLAMMGTANQAQSVINALPFADSSYGINREEKLFVLNLDKISLPSNFRSNTHQMQPLEQVEQNMLIDWIKEYEIEALNAENNNELHQHAKARVMHMLQSKDYWVLYVDGVAVSFSGFNARLHHAVQVGPVWTPPQYRNQGYARTLIFLTLLHAKQQGIKQASLFAYQLGAIKLYKSIGFKEIGSYHFARLKQAKCINHNN